MLEFKGMIIGSKDKIRHPNSTKIPTLMRMRDDRE
jgi:hypothetical protein